jgi:hypothetical protein
MVIVAIQGSKSFDDYAVFLRGIGTALSRMKDGDKELTVYSAGPAHINSMAMEFTNVSERSFKARGIKVKFIKIPPSWIKENIRSVDYFAFFSKPKETTSSLVSYAESKDASVGIFRY